MPDIHHRGGQRRYTIESGAWTRGGQTRDLEVTVTFGEDGVVDHVGVSHRTFTPKGAIALAELASGQEPEWASQQ